MSTDGRTDGRVSRRALVLAGVSGVVVAACAGGESGAGVKPATKASGTVVFKTYLPGEPARQAYEAAMVTWRERNPQIKVDQDFTADSATHTASLTSQLAGGTAPDVAQVEFGWSIDFALDGKFLTLDDYMRQNRVPADEFFPGGLEYLRLNNKQYALPITGHGPLLYYNRELLQKEGLPLPPAQHTWTWSDLLTTAQKVTRRVAGKPEESQWGLMVNFGMPYGVSSAIWQNGGTITDARENPTKTALDAKAQDAVQWLVDLRYRHQVAPTPEEEKALGGNAFVLGKVAMWWGPSFLTYTNLATVKDFWWDIAFVPKGPGGAAAASTATNSHRGLQGRQESGRRLAAAVLLRRRGRRQAARPDPEHPARQPQGVRRGVDEGHPRGAPPDAARHAGVRQGPLEGARLRRLAGRRQRPARQGLRRRRRRLCARGRGRGEQPGHPGPGQAEEVAAVRAAARIIHRATRSARGSRTVHAAAARPGRPQRLGAGGCAQWGNRLVAPGGARV